MTALLERARKIELLVLDVDGVLTDGGLYFGEQGEALKRFHVRDGAGIKALGDTDVAIAVVSGRSFSGTEVRLAELGVTEVIQAATDKVASVEALMAARQLTWQQVCVVCDDTTDLGLMAKAGLAVAVADAHKDVTRQAHLCTDRPGGSGAVRELCDLLLSLHR
jgi:3-deoxy-D-manno-octulosonate 8-phosphate phosphatase (KDO 8-P phosphatase)